MLKYNFFLWIKKKNSFSWAFVENTSHVRLKFINMILDSSIIFYILLTFSITSVKLLYIIFPFLLSRLKFMSLFLLLLRLYGTTSTEFPSFANTILREEILCQLHNQIKAITHTSLQVNAMFYAIFSWTSLRCLGWCSINRALLRAE